MNNISNKIRNTEQWLYSLQIKNENEALHQLGLLFCESIFKGELLLTNEPTLDIHNILPSPIELITYDPNHFSLLAQKLNQSNLMDWKANTEERKFWSEILEGLTLSYAKEEKLLTVAILLRISLLLQLKEKWMDEIIRFLLDQQHPKGYFGLFAEEIESYPEEEQQTIILRLTVEILWTFAEKANQSTVINN